MTQNFQISLQIITFDYEFSHIDINSYDSEKCYLKCEEFYMRKIRISSI